jgi:hypothetical protein
MTDKGATTMTNATEAILEQLDIAARAVRRATDGSMNIADDEAQSVAHDVLHGLAEGLSDAIAAVRRIASVLEQENESEAA